MGGSRGLDWIDPMEELRHMQYRMDKLFKEVFEPSYMGRRLLSEHGEEDLVKTTEPFVDVIEKDKELIVKADIPGVEKKDITLNIKGDMLEITAERKEEKEEKEEGYIRKERGYSSYYRSLHLPTDIDSEKTEATFKDGVLKLTIPKVEVEDVKRIEVK